MSTTTTYGEAGLFRRRMMMDDSRFNGWIRALVRKPSGASSSDSQGWLFQNQYYCDRYVDRVFVDWKEVTPSAYYEFGDNNYHRVWILLKNPTTVPDELFFVQNYSYRYLWIPAQVTTMLSYALRSMGSSQEVDVIFNKYSSGISASQWGTTLRKMWVPADDYAAFLALGSEFNNANMLDIIDNYTGAFY